MFGKDFINNVKNNNNQGSLFNTNLFQNINNNKNDNIKEKDKEKDKNKNKKRR